VTADVVVPDSGGSGTIVAMGVRFGGWSVYLHEARAAHCYNLFRLQRFKIYGDEPGSAGQHQVSR
jgi:arylsulfatase